VSRAKVIKAAVHHFAFCFTVCKVSFNFNYSSECVHEPLLDEETVYYVIHLCVPAGILALLYVTTTLLLPASTDMAPKGQFIIGTAINAGGGRMSLDICLAGEEAAFQRPPSPEAAAMKVPGPGRPVVWDLAGK